MKNRRRVAVKRPSKARPQSTPSEAHGPSQDRDPLDERALVAYLQGTAGNHAVSRLIQRYGEQPATWPVVARHPLGTRQALLSGAGPAHHATTSVQRAPATAPDQARTDERSDYVDLLNGFDELAVSAVQQGGKTLDRVHFGPDLSPTHHSLLEHVRKVLILAQEPAAESKRAAVTDWPALEAQLRTALARAKQLRIPATQVDQIGDMVSAVGEQYIHVRPRRGESLAQQGEDYAELMMGIHQLLTVVKQEAVDKTDAIVPMNIAETDSKQRAALTAVQLGGQLSPQHRSLLESLRNAFLLARTEGLAHQALAEWQSIQGQLRYAFQRAPAFVKEDVGEIRTDLTRIGEQLIHGGVYSEDHNKAVEETRLASPDDAFQVERIKVAREKWELANKLAEKAFNLTGEKVIDRVLDEGEFKGGLGHAIFELVKYRGEVREKIEEFKKKDLIGKAVTIADIADKVVGFINSFVKVSFHVIEKFAEMMVKTAAEAAVEHWKEVAHWAGETLEKLETVEKIAGWVTFAVSAVKVIDAIREGHWGEAATEAGSTGVGFAINAGVKAAIEGSKVAATGEIDVGMAAGGVGMIAGAAVMTAAVIQAFFDAARFVHWCKVENVRDAAMSFISVCTDAAQIEAQDFVADVKLLSEATDASEQEHIQKQLWSYFPYWLRHLEDLSNQVSNDRPSRIGGQSELREALGPAALRILENPGIGLGNWQDMAVQIRVVFDGATRMAEYVTKNYPRTEETEEKKEGESEGGGEKELPAVGAGAGSRAE